MHHIIGDGWSQSILRREFWALYEAYSRGHPDPLPPLRIQYKDYAVWERSEDFRLAERYWSAKLAGAPTRIALLHDQTARKTERFRGDRAECDLDPDTTRGLRDLARQSGTSLSTVVLALFKLLLFRLTSQEDLCVSMVAANRARPDLETMLGCFVNVLPIRTRLSAEMEFDELVGQVAEHVYEALEHQSYPFNLLVSRLDRAGGATARPFLGVIYAWQSGSKVNLSIGANSPPGGSAHRSRSNSPSPSPRPSSV